VFSTTSSVCYDWSRPTLFSSTSVWCTFPAKCSTPPSQVWGLTWGPFCNLFVMLVIITLKNHGRLDNNGADLSSIEEKGPSFTVSKVLRISSLASCDGLGRHRAMDRREGDLTGGRFFPSVSHRVHQRGSSEGSDGEEQVAHPTAHVSAGSAQEIIFGRGWRWL
jgi:hypothetical protein